MSKAPAPHSKKIFQAVIIVGGLVIASPLTSATAGDDSNSGVDYYSGLTCGQLWYARNEIFASRGYCFKSARGQRAFPNSCFAPYGRLPNNLKRTVSLIKKWERRRGCRY